MDFDIYLQSLNEKFLDKEIWAKQTIGANIQHYSDGEDFTDCDIAILGVKEGRGGSTDEDYQSGVNLIRNQLYTLYQHHQNVKMVDLGDIEAGANLSDTYFALSTVVQACVKREVVPIVIGGSQDLTYAIYKAYEGLEQSVNMVSVDPKIDIAIIEDEVTENNYMNHIIMHQPNYLFNYSVLAYQSYHCEDELISLVDKLNFDGYRLGEIRKEIEEVEPVLRGADIVSFDMGALKGSEAPGTMLCSPNGLDGEDACRVTRYAGISDKVSCLGLFGCMAAKDLNGLTSKLAAQMIWYFVDGFAGRMHDYPVATKESYTKYHVHLEEESMDLSFYKSPVSGRWWVEVPYPTDYNHKHARHFLMPCSYEDYLGACEGKLPERWWKAYQKLV